MRAARVRHGIAVSLIVTLLVLRFAGPFASEDGEGEFPRGPVQVVVPFAAGGGSDNFARIIQRAVAEENLLGESLVIVNQGGGSGTIGSRNVKDAKPDGYKILCLHDAIMTAKLSGKVDYGVESFEPIAQTGDIVLMVVVRGDSRFENLSELMEEAKRAPNTVDFGTNIGSPAHFAARKLEEALPGARFNYVQSGGGQNRYSLLVGGTIEVGVFSLGEFIRFRGEGTLRALAAMTPERHPAIPEVPTAVEQGIDAVTSSAQYWWAPKGTPRDRVERLAAMLRQAMESESVRAELQKLWIDPVVRTGSDLDSQLAARTAELGTLSLAEPRGLPNFPLLVMTVVGALGIFVVLSSVRGGGDRGAKEQIPKAAPPQRPLLAGLCCAALLVYVLILQLSLLPYALATILLIVLTGGLMVRWQGRALVVVVEIALLAGLGTELVFTQVFSVALP